MPTYTSPGKLLEVARVEADLSQRELARRAATTQSVVARIEAGRTSPRWSTLEALITAAGFELRTELAQRRVPDSHMLADVARILGLSPEDRIREVAAVNRFVSAARRVEKNAGAVRS